MMIEQVISKADVLAVAGIIRVDSNFLFCTPEILLNSQPDLLPFHCVGGSVNPSEDYISALKREVMEEVGLDCEVVDSKSTKLYNSSGFIGSASLVDKLRPAYIVSKTRKYDEGFLHSGNVVLMGFNVQLNGYRIQPSSEVACAFMFSVSDIILINQGLISIDSLKLLSNATKIYYNSDFVVNKHKFLVPSGLARILTNELMVGEER